MNRSEAPVPDEEWDRFLRDAVAGTGAAEAPREPSARARMVARRLREQPPPAGPARRAHHPPAPARRRAPWFAIVVAAVVVLAIVAFVPGPLTGWFRFGPAAGPGPAAVSAQRPTVREPFRGSPAAGWAEGADGIEVPAAHATGGLSEAEVGRALARTKDFLVASNLDPGVLRGARPDEALGLIDPRQRQVRDYVTRAFREPGPGSDPLRLFSRFDQTRVRFAGDVVRTRGTMTYREGEDGALDVSTDVTYVYPVVRAVAGDDEVVRTIVRREVVARWEAPARSGAPRGTFALLSYASDVTNGGCGDREGYFVPEFGAERATVAPGHGTVIDPYDRARSVDGHTRTGEDGTSCATATRS
ncbi:hypothetical protein [Streptomyces sp. CA-253872]|uniref:hypothetical protein n=1 Tax=Streptomyces sp. CA-253872 TaxID=3240067 RepID=UPI003D8D9002